MMFIRDNKRMKIKNKLLDWMIIGNKKQDWIMNWLNRINKFNS